MSSDLIGRRIIWAADPFVTEPELQLRTLAALAALTRGTEAQIEPVCVLGRYKAEIPVRRLSESRLDVPGGPTVNEMLSPEEALKLWAGEISLPNLREAKSLQDPGGSLRSSVKILLTYAHETGTDLIALSTRSRTGFARLLVGSFAESLLLESDIPLLIVNPNSQPTDRFREIVFPSDVLETSTATYERVLRLARELGASVTIYHKVSVPQGEVASEQGYLEALRGRLSNWKLTGERFGVNVEVRLDETKGNIAESLVRYASGQRSQLIAIAPVSGPAMGTLLGSVTRQVVHHADCPVMILNAPR